MDKTHQDKKPKALKQKYYSFKAQNGFKTFENFKNWYELQDKVCYYCGLTEVESQQVVRFALASKRFPLNGKTGRGKSRGMYLEIDRRKPGTNQEYSETNCVLACYFCNNDKSDVFDDDQYKSFISDRPGFLRGLLANIA